MGPSQRPVVPEAALASHMAILGKTGSGKTYAAKGLAEGILAKEGRVCIVDPTGAWHGLRSSATGKAGGFPVTIFGGSHADLLLAASHGEALAEIVGTSTTPAILDTSQLRVGERTRLFADFADALMRKNRGPLHLFVDEAHMFAPQGRVQDPDSGRMLAAANNLVSGGRSRGLRIVLITQRPAKLHKDSLTQVETLIALRLIAPQDRRAVEDWIKDNADEKQGREIVRSLAGLKTGEGWVWAPELGVLERVSFPRIRTYDSSRAPEEAADGAGPVFAKIDREAIAEKLKAAGADALANDPAALRKRIAELERQAKAKPPVPPAPERVEVPVLGATEVVQLRGLVADLDAAGARACEFAGKLLGAIERAAEAGRARAAAPPSAQPRRQAPAAAPRRDAQARSQAPDAAVGNSGLRRMLVALAQRPNGLTNRQLGVRAGVSSRSGTFSTYLSKARSSGWIYDQGEIRRITERGLRALGDYDPLPEGPELAQHWISELGSSGAARMLRALVDAYPRALSNEELGELAGISSRSGTFSTYLSKLRSLELATGRGEIRASEELA